MTRPQLLLSVSAHRPTRNHLERSFRNVLRRFIVLAAGLLIVSLPVVAFSDQHMADEHMVDEDDDPFDRPGFYMGVSGIYQYNVFQNRIEDVIQDEFEGVTIGGASVENVGVDIDDSAGINATIGYRVWSFFAVELEYEWVDHYDVDGSADLVPVSGPVLSAEGDLYSIEGHTLTANTKWIIPFWRIQPYLLLGGGIAISDVDRGALLNVVDPGGIDDGTHTNVAGRAGLGLDLYITENILVNAEASAILTTLKEPDLNDIDDLNYMSFGAGLQYRF
jgi:opacity protein-like surface antigen